MLQVIAYKYVAVHEVCDMIGLGESRAEKENVKVNINLVILAVTVHWARHDDT